MPPLLLCATISFIGLVASTTQPESAIDEPLLESVDFKLVSDVELLTICVVEINQQRVNNGKSPAHHHGQVEQAAYNHNAHMVQHNCFSHQCPGEPGLGDRLSATGYQWSGVGEIIAANADDNCVGAVNQWMNSPGHRDILLGDFQHVGCSGLICNNCQYRTYWTCVFANSF